MKLKAENLIKSYKGRKVVKEVTLEVNQGEIVGLLGPTGNPSSAYRMAGFKTSDRGMVP